MQFRATIRPSAEMSRNACRPKASAGREKSRGYCSFAFAPETEDSASPLWEGAV